MMEHNISRNNGSRYSQYGDHIQTDLIDRLHRQCAHACRQTDH